MVNEPISISEREFNHDIDKLSEASQKCDKIALKWVMTSIRNNEKALFKGEITENKYMEQLQKITSLIVFFSYNCKIVLCQRNS